MAPIPLKYRTTDLAQWGAGVSPPRDLDAPEIDQNFWDLANALSELAQLEPNNITAITVGGVNYNEMTVHFEDGSTLGPFTLPTATFKFRGEWAPSTIYNANDLFTKQNALWFTNITHTSDLTFNPAAGNMVGPYASKIMPFPTQFTIGLFFPNAPGKGISVDEEGYSPNDAMMGYLFTRQATAPVDFAGSLARLRVAPTAACTYAICRNDTEIGTLTFAIGETAGVFELDEEAFFDVGDTLRILRDDELDDTARDLNVTFELNQVTVS